MNLSYSLLRAVQGTHKPFIHLLLLIMNKKYGVVGISKVENAQLGLILKWLNGVEYNNLTVDGAKVIQYPEALEKLISRYK